MKTQDKQAEINLVESELRQGSWRESDSEHKVRRRQLELLLPTLPENWLILDAGCGPGTYGIILAQRGNRVIGIDISFKATEAARERSNKENVEFLPIVGDLEKLPFKDNSFDICFCGYTLHHFPDICLAVRELARVTKPGGKIALTEPNGSNPAVRLSCSLENLIRGWLVKLGLDTPNETIHRYEVYIKALQQEGFEGTRVGSCYLGGLPPLPTKARKLGFVSLRPLIIHILARLRRLLFIITDRLLPSPLNGADLLITGTKKETRLRNSHG